MNFAYLFTMSSWQLALKSEQTYLILFIVEVYHFMKR